MLRKGLGCLLAGRRWGQLGTSLSSSSSATESTMTEIRYPNGKLRRLSAAWLRFNCRCPECHNAATRQRSVSPSAALSAAASQPQLSQLPDKSGIRLDWPDGHLTEFAYSQLDALLSPDGGGVERRLWNRSAGHPFEGPSAIRPVPLAEVESSQGGLRTVLRNLWSSGVATVTEVEPTEAATEAAVQLLAPVMHTLFGRMWTFSADGKRQDTAYGSDAIGVHNDNTYLHSCAGLQVFHVLQPATEGGQTCLADGFLAAETLRRESGEHFKLLASRPVYHHYLEDGGPGGPAYHTRCLDSVIKLDPEGNDCPYQIRYNPYDIDTLTTLPQAEVATYLAAYAHLGDILNRPDSQIRINLQPGTVLFIDNWRVLHGRCGFSGTRIVTGCYVTRDDWMSKARILRVV